MIGVEAQRKGGRADWKSCILSRSPPPICRMFSSSERPNNYPGAPFPFQPPPGYRPSQPFFGGDCVFPSRVPGPTTALQHLQPPAVPTEEHGHFSRVTSAAYQRHLQQTQPGAQTTNTPAIEASRLEAEGNKARERADRAEDVRNDVITKLEKLEASRERSEQNAYMRPSLPLSPEISC